MPYMRKDSQYRTGRRFRAIWQMVLRQVHARRSNIQSGVYGDSQIKVWAGCRPCLENTRRHRENQDTAYRKVRCREGADSRTTETDMPRTLWRRQQHEECGRPGRIPESTPWKIRRRLYMGYSRCQGKKPKRLFSKDTESTFQARPNV